MNHLKSRFKFLMSVKLFIIVVIMTTFFFYFLDINLFKLSRSLGSIVFDFFREFIDPLSDIIDPGIILAIAVILWLLLINLKNITNEPNKLKILSLKVNSSKEIIIGSINYYILIAKHVICSIIFTGIILHITKYILGVSRPKYFFFEGYERQDFFNLEHRVNSLPSGHTQAAFTLAILFILYVNRYMILVIILASLLALARIFMNAHFPSDLILGSYIGSFFPILLYKLYFLDKFQNINEKNVFNFKDLIKLLYFRVFI